MTVHRSAGKIETKDRRRREGGMAIFSELLKIADFLGLCVASLKAPSILTKIMCCLFNKLVLFIGN